MKKFFDPPPVEQIKQDLSCPGRTVMMDRGRKGRPRSPEVRKAIVEPMRTVRLESRKRTLVRRWAW